MSQVGFFLYIGDWIKDTRCLSPAARGCWVDSLCYLYDRGGSVEQDMEAYGFWWSISPVSAAEILLEFERTSVADVKWQNDSKGMAKNDKTVIAKLSNRRMVRETQKRLETKEKRAEAGRAGANKRWQNVDGKNAVLPSPSPSLSLNSYKNKNTQRPVVEASVSSDKISVHDFVDSWNATFAGKLPVVKLPLTESRKRRVTARLREHSDLVFWETVFTNIDKSRFLLGHSSNGSHPSWRCTFDFLITNDTNCVKIHEGSYNAKN